MKLKYSRSFRNIKNKSLSLSTILNSEYLFPHSTKIQMALNRRRVVSKDFNIKLVQPKTNTGKKKRIAHKDKDDYLNSYQDSFKELERQDIPLELSLILSNYRKKLLKESNKFFSIKQYNDRVLDFLKLLNKLNKKKERDNLLKKYFPNEDNNNCVNLDSDQIQKLAENLFKSNPLLTYNNYSEIFFHYLSEFYHNCNDNDKINNIKQKIIKFLNKLNDFVEYVEINNDEDIDGVIRDVKIKNLKYLKEYGNKIKNETIKIKEKIKILDKKTIEESKKMIDQTKNTISDLVENKNMFEDPKNFNLYYSYNYNKIRNKKSRNIFLSKNNKVDTQNITKNRLLFSNKTGRFSNTLITGINLSEKKDSLKKDENKNGYSNEKLFNNLKISRINKNRHSLRRFSSNVSDINLKTPLIDSYKSRGIYTLKKNTNISQNSVDKELNSQRNSLLSSEINDKKTQPTSKFSKQYKHSKSIDCFASLTNKSKKIKIKSLFYKNKIINLEEKKNIQKEILNEMKEINFKKKEEPSVIRLYDDIKNKNKLKKNDVENIKKYFSLKGKKIDPNVDSLFLIKTANRIANKLDIEKTTKKVFQPYLSYNQIQKLENIEKVNDKLYSLRYDYMSRIFDFKARNSESIHNYI